MKFNKTFIVFEKKQYRKPLNNTFQLQKNWEHVFISFQFNEKQT